MAWRPALGWLAVNAAGLAGLTLGLDATSRPGMSLLLAFEAGLIWLVAAAGWSWVIVRRPAPAGKTIRSLAPWLVFPFASALCLALVLTDMPTRARFELSKPALERALADIEAGRPVRPGWLGLVPVTGAERWDLDSVVIWVDATDRLLDGPCGYMHTTVAPDRYSGAIEELGGGWWIWYRPFMD